MNGNFAKLGLSNQDNQLCDPDRAQPFEILRNTGCFNGNSF